MRILVPHAPCVEARVASIYAERCHRAAILSKVRKTIAILLIFLWTASHQAAAFTSAVLSNTTSHQNTEFQAEMSSHHGNLALLLPGNDTTHHHGEMKGQACTNGCSQIICQCPIGGGHVMSASSSPQFFGQHGISTQRITVV